MVSSGGITTLASERLEEVTSLVSSIRTMLREVHASGRDVRTQASSLRSAVDELRGVFPWGHFLGHPTSDTLVEAPVWLVGRGRGAPRGRGSARGRARGRGPVPHFRGEGSYRG